MPYTLVHFGTTPLPDTMQEEDFSTGVVSSGLVGSIGASFNYFGSNTRYPRAQQFPHRGRYVGRVLYRITDDGAYRLTDNGNYRTTAPSAIADLAGKVDDLKAKLGQWDVLWRKRISDGVLTWKECRLLRVDHVENIENANVVSDITSIFETLDVGWRADTVTSVTRTPADISTAYLPIAVAGTAPVRDAILTITRITGTVTSVDVTGPGIDFTWTGSLGVGDVLVIDSGDKTILDDGVDAYNGLVFNAGHTIDDWLLLPRGRSEFQVTPVGGRVSTNITFYDQFI
jgi:hypothetical protein